jgi:hypothetical protein
MMNLVGSVGFVVLSAALAACASHSGYETEQVGLGAEPYLTRRAGTVVVDGCVLDSWQRSTLASPATKRIVEEVVMLCLVPRVDGTIGPRDASARAAFAALAAELKQEGYRVDFGVSFTDESGQRYDGMQTRNLIGDPEWRQQFRESLEPLLDPVDGVEIDLQELPGDATAQVTAFFKELAPVVRPARHLDVFLPPSVSVPSDLPDGNAFSRTELAPFVDRMRVMTLDYSDDRPGPTIDPGWAVDAVRLAKRTFPNVDIAYPLYGTDFGPGGHRSVTYDDARAIAALQDRPIERGPTGAPHVHWSGFGGEDHELWFDDAESTGRALGAWSADVLPPDVGIVFYGLGAEDPTLFSLVSARTQ